MNTAYRTGTVLTQGVFDLMHSNHLAALRKARALGSRLVVGVHSDQVVASYKRQPVLSESERLLQVQAVRWVDEAYIDHNPLTPEALAAEIDRLGADAYVYFGRGFDDYYRLIAQRGIFHRFDYHQGISTTGIVAEIKSRLADGTL